MQCKARFNISYIPAESQIWWKLPCFLPVGLTGDMWMRCSSGTVHTNVSASSTVGQIPTCNRITLIAHQLSSRSKIILRFQINAGAHRSLCYVCSNFLGFPLFLPVMAKSLTMMIHIPVCIFQGPEESSSSSSLALLANALPPLHS